MRCPDCNSKVDPYTRWCTTCHLWVVDAEEDKAEARGNGQDRLFNNGDSSKETWKDILGITEIKNREFLPCPVCGEKISRKSGDKVGFNREFICKKCNSILTYNSPKLFIALGFSVFITLMQVIIEFLDMKSHSLSAVNAVLLIVGLIAIFYAEPNVKSLEVKGRHKMKDRKTNQD